MLNNSSDLRMVELIYACALKFMYQGGVIYSESSELNVAGCEIHSNSAVRHCLFLFIYDTFIYVVHRHYDNSSSLRLKSLKSLSHYYLLGFRRDNYGGRRVPSIVVFRAYYLTSLIGCKFQ